MKTFKVFLVESSDRDRTQTVSANYWWIDNSGALLFPKHGGEGVTTFGPRVWERVIEIKEA